MPKYRTDDINELELISEVQNRPVLYDPAASQQPKVDIELAWKEVADTLKIDFETARKRWRNLRDTLIKEHRALLSPLRKKKRPWYYYDHMKFLIPYCRTLSDNIQQDNESDQEWKFKAVKRKNDDSTTASSRPRRSLPVKFKKLSDLLDGPEEVSLDVSENGARGYDSPAVDQTRDGCEMSMRVDDKCFCCGSNTQIREERVRDSDEHFLLSLLPSFKRLSPKNNSQMRIRFQQLLHDIEFGDND